MGSDINRVLLYTEHSHSHASRSLRLRTIGTHPAASGQRQRRGLLSAAGRSHIITYIFSGFKRDDRRDSGDGAKVFELEKLMENLLWETSSDWRFDHSHRRRICTQARYRPRRRACLPPMCAGSPWRSLRKHNHPCQSHRQRRCKPCRSTVGKRQFMRRAVLMISCPLTPSPIHESGQPGEHIFPGALVGTVGAAVVGDLVGSIMILVS